MLALRVRLCGLSTCRAEAKPCKGNSILANHQELGMKRHPQRRLQSLAPYRDKSSWKEFNVDVLKANPSFAGDIKETRIVTKDDLNNQHNELAIQPRC